MPKANIITGLDIGTSSIKGLSVSKKPDSEKLEVLAQISIPSFGLRKGVVVNVEEVSRKINQLKNELQNLTGQKIEEVFVNINGAHISGVFSQGTVIVSRADQKISQEDLERALEAAQAISLPPNKEILEVFPRQFFIDGQPGIKEVLGLKGVKLEVEALNLCCFAPYLDNLTKAVLDANFQIAQIISSPIAAARACLTPQEKELGVAVLDIGAGTTGLAVYGEGELLHTAIFPIGSNHITNDIAIGLRCDIETAEQIKREFGSCIFSGTRKRERIQLSGESLPLVFSHKMLVGIIEDRVSEIFREVLRELKKIPGQPPLPAGVVLTGGGSKIPKITDLAKRELKLSSKIGLPRGFFPDQEDSSLTTVCGLVLTATDLEEREIFPISTQGIGAILKKLFKIFLP